MTDNVAPVPGTGKPNLWNIPEQLRVRPQWVLHKAKVPHQPNGLLASVTSPNTWSSFTEVLAALKSGKFDGICFIFTADDPYCGIDLDGCRDLVTGDIASWAGEIVGDLNTYAEVSPSGTGVHVIARASVPEGRKVDGIEIYSQARAFTMTGWHLEGTSSTVNDAQEPVMDLWGDLTALQGGASGKALKIPEDAVNWGADPESIRDQLKKMLASDAQFRRTWEHDRPDLSGQSLSDYDLSLLSQAVLVHDWSDPTVLYLLIRLHREHYGDPKKKWKRRDYVRRTVGKALKEAEAADDEDADARVLIKIEPGQMPSIVREAAAALGQATLSNPFDGVYRHGNRLVLVTRRVVRLQPEKQGDVK